MSKTGKIIVSIIVLIIVIWFIWWIAAKSPSSPVSSSGSVTPVAPVAPVTTETNAASNLAVTSSSSIDSDFNSIDAQMNGLSQDNANINTSVASPSVSQ